MMGSICSRKREQSVIEEEVARRVVSGRYCRSSSSKWLEAASFRCRNVEHAPGVAGICPSLLELCISKICQVLSLSLCKVCNRVISSGGLDSFGFMF